MTTTTPSPLVGVIMGSASDWERCMKFAAETLAQFDLPHECRVVSAHRTPDWMTEYAHSAAARGLEVIIAGAGGAAHLPGMVAGHTLLPVIGVPVQSQALNGLDSLLSIVQMPRRCSRRHNGHRQGGRDQRRAARRLHTGLGAARAAHPTARVPPKPSRPGHGRAARDRRVEEWRARGCSRCLPAPRSASLAAGS